MAEFEFVGQVTITINTTVEADTLEEAIEIVKERRSMMSIVTNNGDTPDEVWMIDELDGDPCKIRLEGSDEIIKN